MRRPVTRLIAVIIVILAAVYFALSLLLSEWSPVKWVEAYKNMQIETPDDSTNNYVDTNIVVPAQNETVYGIEYDSLGWASMSVIKLGCADKAAANEKVTFTAAVKTEYANAYKISKVAVRLGSGEDYIENLQGSNGSYTFTMPDAATMEAEINESHITLMFYIVPIDM